MVIHCLKTSVALIIKDGNFYRHQHLSQFLIRPGPLVVPACIQNLITQAALKTHRVHNSKKLLPIHIQQAVWHPPTLLPKSGSHFPKFQLFPAASHFLWITLQPVSASSLLASSST